MKNYKGYYIDGVIYKSEAEIDKFLETQAVEAYKTACWYFNKEMSMEASMYADEKAEILVNKFGYTWEQVEEIELEVLKTA